MDNEESRPILRTKTVDKATEYGKKHGLRMWAVYDKAINLLIEQDEKGDKEE
jgi:hypothetical protein